MMLWTRDYSDEIWHNDVSFNQLLDKVRQELLALKAYFIANEDTRLKYVGDKVRVWDGSWNRDRNTGEDRMGIDPLFKNNTAIVIETNCNQWYVSEINGDKRQLDLLLVFPQGELVYCSSRLVRIV
jgi:hypothetical protein